MIADERVARVHHGNVFPSVWDVLRETALQSTRERVYVYVLQMVAYSCMCVHRQQLISCHGTLAPMYYMHIPFICMYNVCAHTLGNIANQHEGFAFDEITPFTAD